MKLNKLATRLEIKAADDSGVIEGMGSVFGNVDSYGDIVAKGAFGESLSSGRRAKMLWQHDPAQPIGIWTEIAETDEGLSVRGQIATDTQMGRDVAGLLRMGAVDGLSIGFVSKASTFDKQSGVRTITRADLWEVSVVTFPANELAVVTSVKSMEEIDAMDLSEIEKSLREAGFSRGEAKGFIHRITAIVEQREAGQRSAAEEKAALLALLGKLRA